MSESGSGLAIVRDTKAALDAMGAMGAMHRAHAMRLGVELQALLDGQIDWVAKGKGERKDIVKKASPAMCCAAVMVCMQNGLSVGAGHVQMLGGNLYVTEVGYLAAAEFARDEEGKPLFRGFSAPEPISDDERRMLGIADKERFQCAMKVRASHAVYPDAVGYGWWDGNKDQESSMSVPAKKAHTRARRHALKQLFGLGSNPDDTPALGAEDSDAPTVEVVVSDPPEEKRAPTLRAPDDEPKPVKEILVDEFDEDLPEDKGALYEPHEFEKLENPAIACKTFLRLAWHHDQHAVKEACKAADCTPAEATNLPVDELHELVQQVASNINDAQAVSGLCRDTLEAMED